MNVLRKQNARYVLHALSVFILPPVYLPALQNEANITSGVYGMIV